jgi:hypothetical protein
MPAPASTSSPASGPKYLSLSDWRGRRHVTACGRTRSGGLPWLDLFAFRISGLLHAPYNGKSVPIDVGCSENIPEPIRRAVILRDKKCAWAGGCDKRPAACDVHHIPGRPSHPSHWRSRPEATLPAAGVSLPVRVGLGRVLAICIMLRHLYSASQCHESQQRLFSRRPELARAELFGLCATAATQPAQE